MTETAWERPTAKSLEERAREAAEATKDTPSPITVRAYLAASGDPVPDDAD